MSGAAVTLLAILVGACCILFALGGFVGVSQYLGVQSIASAKQAEADKAHATSGDKLAQAQKALDAVLADQETARANLTKQQATKATTNLSDLLKDAAKSAASGGGGTSTGADGTVLPPPPPIGVTVFADCSGTGASAILPPGFYRLWRGSDANSPLDVKFPVKAIRIPTGFFVDLSDSELEDVGNITVLKETGTTLLCLGSVPYLDNYWIPGILRGLRVRPSNTTASFGVKRRIVLWSTVGGWADFTGAPNKYLDIQVSPNGSPFRGAATGVTSTNVIQNTQDVWPGGYPDYIRGIGAPRGLKVRAKRYNANSGDESAFGDRSPVVMGSGEFIDDSKGQRLGLGARPVYDPYCEQSRLDCTAQTLTIMADPPKESWPGKGVAP
jgi:Flp pilus assembly protein TadG